MNSEQWGKIEALVDEALKKPVHERMAFIEESCKNTPDLKKEVLEFLDYISESDGWLEDSGEYKRAIFEDLTDDINHLNYSESIIGNKVGAYTLTRELAKGGMGTVYLAKRTDGVFEHEVAIKKVNPGSINEDTIERFKRERNILANLNHPHIAQIFDGGVTDKGIPYCVMEFVDGVSVTEYCKNNNLDLTQRLNLFIQILQAVQHAHENLVIHHDIKPANILVKNDGQVKILDFGISKLIRGNSQEENEQYHKQLLTIKYASPEQIKNEYITTATDIYSLGLVLYEMLTHNIPYNFGECNYFEINKIILNSEPIIPSQNIAPEANIRARQISGELDAVIMKAIHKNPEKRYRSVTTFWNDLINFKKNKPVSTYEDSLTYRTQKLIQRNKIGFTLSTVIFALILFFSVFYTLSITDQKEQAQFEAAKAEEISDFLIQLFEASDPSNNIGNTFTTRELLDNGLAQIENLQNQPLMQARLFDITGQVYRNIGLYDEAQQQIVEAIQIRENKLGENHPLTLSSRHNLGLVLNDMGLFQEAASLFEQVYEDRRSIYGREHIDVASTQAFWAFSLRRQGKYEIAEQMARESLEIFRNELGLNHLQTLDNINKLAITLHNKGNYGEAEEYYKEVLDLRKQKLGELHPQVAKSYNNLASLYLNTGRFHEALELMKKALSIHKHLYGEFHPNIALVSNNMGLVHTKLGNYEKADSLFNYAIDMRTVLLGNDHVNTAISYFTKANLMLEMQYPDSAIGLFEKANKILNKELSEDHSFSAQAMLGIGRGLAQKGNFEEAQSYFSSGIERIREIHGEGSIERAMAEYYFGLYQMNIGNYDSAQTLIENASAALYDIEGHDGLRYHQVSNELEKLTSR